MINVVYYNDFIRCFRNGVVERFYWNEWRIVPNTGFRQGYNHIDINDKNVLRHRLIAFCFLGLENILGLIRSVDVIDHKDRNKLNNCVENLRITTGSGNQHNRSNAKGYSFKSGKYEARIRVNYKHIHLGRYDTEDEARTAYLEGKRKYHLE